MFMDNTKNYKHIIWDWNGTLFDDVDIVIDAMNNLLQKRNLPLLDKEKYRSIFTFPVNDYYANLGFDFSVGDTIHDYEVAEEIGCDCLLVSNGHQSFERISCCNALIVETISDVIDFIKTEAIA